MSRTRLRDEALLSLAPGTGVVALVVDHGVADAVPARALEAQLDGLAAAAGGVDSPARLRAALDGLGEALRRWFPRQGDDVNELSDEVLLWPGF